MQKQINQISFAGQTIYLGIDVHKKSWKVTVLSEHYEHKTMSMDPSAEKLAGYLHKHFSEARFKAVYEAGFCGFGAQRQLAGLGIECMVIHPADLPSGQSDRQKKTDTHDSRSLARYLKGGILRGIDIPDVQLESDRILIRQRFTISKDVARCKHRIKSLLDFQGISIPKDINDNQSRHWSADYVQWLTDVQKSMNPQAAAALNNHVRQVDFLRSELKRTNRQIVELAQTERYRKDIELLRSIPGIGFSSSITILTQLGDIRRFKNLDVLCSYVGLMPSSHSSGEKSVTGKLVNRGRKEIKIMLIEAAWIAVAKDPVLMLKFNELAVKMNKNKAIIRIARKLLSRIRYVLCNQQPYVTGIVK